MIELNIEYTKEDKNNYQQTLRKYMKLNKSKYQYILYFIIPLIAFLLLTGMYSSNKVQFRYCYFASLIIIPILLKLYFSRKNKFVSSINARYQNIERPLQKVTINNHTVIMDTFDSIYTYKSNWFKYIFIYDDNIALSSSDLSGIIIPKRYLNNNIQKNIFEIFRNIEKIKIS